MSNEIAAKQHAKEAEMSKNIHDFLRSNDLIKSFVFDEGDYDEQTLALVKKQVLDDDGKVVDGVYTILVEDYLSNLQTNLNMRFAGIYNVQEDVLYLKYGDEMNESSQFDIFTYDDFSGDNRWVKWESAISHKFTYNLVKKAEQRASEMYKTGKWKKEFSSKDDVERLIMKRSVSEMFEPNVSQEHSAFKMYFGEYYVPSDRLLALASVDESYINRYVDRLLNMNNGFILEDLKEMIYKNLKDKTNLSFDADRNLSMFSKIKYIINEDGKLNKNSMLDIAYTDKKGKTKIENNINPEVFKEYFETITLSDLVNYNVFTLPTDKADRLWNTKISINDIQKLILDGQVVWARYKADMK